MQPQPGQLIRAPFLSAPAEVRKFEPRSCYCLLEVVLDDEHHTFKPLRATVEQLAQQGRIPAEKVVRHWRFHRATLLKWIAGELIRTESEVSETSMREIFFPLIICIFAAGVLFRELKEVCVTSCVLTLDLIQFRRKIDKNGIFPYKLNKSLLFFWEQVARRAHTAAALLIRRSQPSCRLVSSSKKSSESCNSRPHFHKIHIVKVLTGLCSDCAEPALAKPIIIIQKKYIHSAPYPFAGVK
jgi:excisionase family DNA binding protein